MEKRGLLVERQRIRIPHYYGSIKGGIHKKIGIVPALVALTVPNRATIFFAKTEDQAVDAGMAPLSTNGIFPNEGTVTLDYRRNVVLIWDSQPPKNKARLVEGCLS
jgi:hypothetical protein